jgi:hypothetical protein
MSWQPASGLLALVKAVRALPLLRLTCSLLLLWTVPGASAKHRNVESP